jgi:hypothetical protein
MGRLKFPLLRRQGNTIVVEERTHEQLEDDIVRAMEAMITPQQQEQLQTLLVDATYLFTFADGHTERHRGSWLMKTDGVGWKMDDKKASQIIEYQQIK